MPLLTLSDVEAYVGARELFRVARAHVSSGERVALIGPNGVGKSTLLGAILSAHGGGEQGSPASSPVTVTGGISIARGVSVAHLAQRPPADGPPPPPGAFARGCPPPERLSMLSAGQRTRAALARVLAADPDLLLLDEPTNHLDAEGLGLLAGTMAAFRGAALIVSHDRAFLDAVATAVWELDRPWGEGGARLRVFPGNYTAYRRQAGLVAETERRAFADHAARREHLEAAARRQMEWARRAFADAGVRNPHGQRLAKKMARRAKAYGRRLDRLVGEAPPKPWARDTVLVPVSGARFGGAQLMTAEDLEVAPKGAAAVLACDRLVVRPRASVALVGANGLGKTTLLRTLAGELPPASGRLWVSPAARIAHVAQDPDDRLGSGRSALDALAEVPNASREQAWSTAALLGLRRERAAVPLRALSGGERSAVALACALQAGAHVLLLDEPTNHLDLWLREAVEAALAAFPGAVVLATHDRWLVDCWADEVWRAERPPAVEAPARLRVSGVPNGGRAGDRSGTDRSPATPDADTTEMLRRMRLAELAGRLADPRLARQPAERARIESEMQRLSDPRP